MSFNIGDKVRVDRAKKGPSSGCPVGVGVISGVLLKNYINPAAGLQYQVVIRNGGAPYTVYEEELTILKTQKLYAYTDVTEEVHWATKLYKAKELTDFGFVRAEKFDKSIDLE